MLYSVIEDETFCYLHIFSFSLPKVLDDLSSMVTEATGDPQVVESLKMGLNYLVSTIKLLQGDKLELPGNSLLLF